MSSAKYWIVLVAILASMYTSFVAFRKFQQIQQTTASAGVGGATTPVTFPDTPVPPFTLTDQNDQPFDSKSLEGKVWVGSFFFVSCPSICWRMNQALADLQLSAPGDEVRYISMTCDPDTDTPEVLSHYAEKLKADPARWTFLTGGLPEIQTVGHSLLVAVEKNTHSSKAIVVDRTGRVRGQFNVTEPDQLQKLTKLLAELVKENEKVAGG